MMPQETPTDKKQKRKILKRLDRCFEILKYNGGDYFNHGRIYESIRAVKNWYINEKCRYEIEFGRGTEELKKELEKIL
jgi:hypothetical protein